MLNIKYYLQDPKLILLSLLQKTAKFYPDKFYVKAQYWLKTGKKLNLKNPQTFSEKLQWLKLYDKKPEYTIMADKITAKKYVANIIGDEYIIPTLGVWNRFEDINFDELPDQFVLKTNHDSGGIIICKNKNNLNIDFARNKLEKHLRRNVYAVSREYPYKNIKPQIFAEKYMVDESGTELKDYKFFCFNGQVKYIQVDFNRFTNHQRNIYDTHWRFQDFMIKYPNNKNYMIKKPVNLDKMISIAETLSKGLPHLRVDLYSIDNNIYFGELSFCHGSGMERFTPNEWDHKFGSLLKIDRKTC